MMGSYTGSVRYADSSAFYPFMLQDFVYRQIFPHNARMKHAWFISGTDTEVGKTFITCALLHLCAQRQWQTVGMKPIAAGCDALGHNEDTEQIREAASILLERTSITPFLLRQAIAPQIAATQDKLCIDFAHIHSVFSELSGRAEVVLVEGVGGFRVPLGLSPDGQPQDSADLATSLALPIILVVGMRLGCQNHALLSVEAMLKRGLTVAGWVANTLDEAMPCLPENIEILRQLIAAPLLGVVPRCQDAREAAQYLSLPDPL